MIAEILKFTVSTLRLFFVFPRIKQAYLTFGTNAMCRKYETNVL